MEWFHCILQPLYKADDVLIFDANFPALSGLSFIRACWTGVVSLVSILRALYTFQSSSVRRTISSFVLVFIDSWMLSKVSSSIKSFAIKVSASLDG